LLKNRVVLDEDIAASMKEDVVPQFVEFRLYMNMLRHKSRLVAARLGRDDSLEQAESLDWPL
jgi:hypothetical protein